MNETEILKAMEIMFQEDEFDCSFETSEALPFGCLLVYLGTDHFDRNRVLEITAQEQELGESLRETPIEHKFVRVQFEVTLPFDTKDYTANEVASLQALINRMIELPGFEFDEIDSKVFYRYVLLTPKTGIEKDLVVGITGVIMLYLEMFSEMMERVAEGKNTFSEILEQTLELFETMGK